MEPRPTPRRAAPSNLSPAPNGSVAPPADSPGSYAPANGYGPEDGGSAAPYDPYTAPEATSYFAPMPDDGDPSQAQTRMGPLADEPVFYPNPSLPPNRPSYDPDAAAYQQRADFALHPVGRVPPDHQPLNLRPAPPPAPPPVMPSNRDALIRGILAAVIGLAAVVLLVIAILAWSDNVSLFGGSGAPTPTAGSLLAGPSGASGVAIASGSAIAAASGSSTGNIPVGSGAPSPSGAASDSSAGPGTAPASSAGQDAGRASGSGQLSGSSRPRSASGSPRGSGGTNASASGGDISAYLPDSSAIPAGFSQTDAGDRTKDEVAATFGSDPTQASTDLDTWGWQANSYVVYDASPQPPDDQVNRLGVSTHQFASADGAATALPVFVESFGAPQIDLPADANLGANAVAMQTTNNDGNLVVLYVQKDNYVLKIDAASVNGDPLQAAVDLAKTLVG